MHVTDRRIGFKCQFITVRTVNTIVNKHDFSFKESLFERKQVYRRTMLPPSGSDWNNHANKSFFYITCSLHLLRVRAMFQIICVTEIIKKDFPHTKNDLNY